MNKLLKSISLVLGIFILLVGWQLIYEMEILFTEANLVGYYCCVTEQDLPATGTIARTVSDFFNSNIGIQIPSLIVITLHATFFTIALIKTEKRHYWWLPYPFILIIILFASTFLATSALSWAISNWINGPRTGPFKGYERTWYGIALNLLSWLGFWLLYIKTTAKLPTKPHPITS